jgi:hypothetical protein
MGAAQGHNRSAATKGLGGFVPLGLFHAMLLGVGFRCFFSMPSGVISVRIRCVSMVRRLLVISGLVMLGRFSVVPGSMRGMF